MRASTKSTRASGEVISMNLNRRKSSFSVVISLCFALLTVSCGTKPSLPLNDSAELLPDEAALLVRFHAVQATGLLSIHHGVVSLPRAAFTIAPREQLKLVKIKAADGLRISTYQVTDTSGRNKMAYFDNTKLNFNVRPQTITYIGDVLVEEGPNSVGLRLRDNEASTKALATSTYPLLFAKYKYEKFIPTDKQNH